MDSVQALARGLLILDRLVEADDDPVRHGRGTTAQALAVELDVHKTTVLRLIRTLIDAGYAAPAPNGGNGYVPGPALRRTGALPDATERFKLLARPHLERLVEATGECAHAAVADGGRALVIDDVETDAPLRVVATSGRHVPLHCTSAGKVLLAYGLAEVPAALPARTPRTITRASVLRRHLEEVRALGYAFDDEENDVHTRCISAPVFDAAGTPVGCVGIDAPSVRLTPERLDAAADSVKAAARAVSRDLGHPG